MMAGGHEIRTMLENLFQSAGLDVTEDDLEVAGQLHEGFAGQRSRLTGAVQSETEPMTIPAFDRVRQESEATDEPAG